MKSGRWRPLSSVVLAVLLLARAGRAGTPVAAWERIYRPSAAGRGETAPLAARELADGSVLVVNADASGMTAARYDHAGGLLSASSFYPDWGPSLPAYRKIAIDPFGGIVVVATTATDVSSPLDTGDIWAMKYDGFSGRELWESPFDYDGPDHLADVPLEALIDPTGDVVTSGISNPSAPAGKHFTLKIDGLRGTLVWARTVIGAESSATALDGSGNVFFAYTDYPSGSPATLEYAALDGALLWGPVTTSGYGSPTVSAADASGDLYVASFFQSPGYGFEVTKYSGRTGAVLWGPVQQATSVNGQPTAIAVGAGNTLVVAASPGILLEYAADSGHVVWGPVLAGGASGSSAALSIAPGGDVLFTSAAGEGLATWRYAGPTGSLIWGPASVPETSSFNAPIAFLASNGRVVTAVQDSHSKVFERDGSTGSIVWGPTDFLGLADGDARINDLGTGPDGNPLVAVNLAASGGTRSMGIIKYDRTTGAVIWGPTIVATPYPGGLFPFQVLGDRFNNVLVAGPGVVIKLNGATGALLWQSPQIPSPQRIALDASGDVLAIGSSPGPGAHDFATVKISGASGHILWGPVAFDNSGAEDIAVSLAVDGAGDVIITGESTDLQTFAAGISTLKYSGKTGALMWGPVFLPDGRVDDLALDSAGNAVVIGQLRTDMLTIKYSGANGAVLWGPKLVNGSGDYYDTALRVAISPGGDVFVTGNAYSSGGTYDWATLKYRGGDGAVLWGPILLPAAPPHGGNTPNAIGLDPSGDVVVAGTVADSQNNSDSATIKYDGSTGAVLWGPLLGGRPDGVEVNGLSVAAGSVVIAGRTAQSAFTRAYTENGIETTPVRVPRSVSIVRFRGP